MGWFFIIFVGWGFLFEGGWCGKCELAGFADLWEMWNMAMD
jgi:hypothetical protein